jgi:hypothetical protein
MWEILKSVFYSALQYQITHEKEKKLRKNRKKIEELSCFCQTLGLWQIRSFGAGVLNYFFSLSTHHKLQGSL